jgi:HAD superfamily hydrolase (TIGR01484 family)
MDAIEMTGQRVWAILSDYDGTLLPTARVKNETTNAVPKELEQVLDRISAEIPVCVVSTKDFEFLRMRTTFAKVLSCMMGIETLVMTNLESSHAIEKHFLNTDSITLQANSKALQNIAEDITSQEDFSQVKVEYKHTTDGILAGLTVDWRHLSDWSCYSAGISHAIARMTATLKRALVPANVYVQKYSTHPFIDIYSTECNKGMAFDTVVTELADAGVDATSVLYLGDSENDNPAFRKAGISIGIRSDARLNPKLDCSYFLNYEELPYFLMKLQENDYVFTDGLLVGRKA